MLGGAEGVDTELYANGLQNCKIDVYIYMSVDNYIYNYKHALYIYSTARWRH